MTADEIEQRQRNEFYKKQKAKDEAHRKKINTGTAFIVPIVPIDKVAEMQERKLEIPEPIAPATLINQSTLLKLDILTQNNTAIAGTTPQWVNLPKEKKWLDAVCTDIERLGTDVKLRVKIDLPNSPHTFTIEKICKPFKGSFETVETKSFSKTSDDDGNIFINVFSVGSDGKEEYTFRARSDGNIANSSNLMTWRKFYVHHFFEKTVENEANVQAVWKDVFNEYKSHNIWVSGMAAYENKISEYEFGSNLDLNRGDSNKYELRDALEKVYQSEDLSEKEPFLIPIAYLNTIDESEIMEMDRPLNIVKDESVFIEVKDEEKGYGIFKTKDQNSPFMDAFILWNYKDQELEDENEEETEIPIKLKCRLIGGDYDVIDVQDWKGEDISHFNLPLEEIDKIEFSDEKDYKIYINFKVLKQRRKGIAPNTNNLIVIRTEDNDKMAETITHEIGHKCGLVADGKPDTKYLPSKGLEKGKDQYFNNGSHCGFGLSNTAHIQKNRENAKCVMFGLVYQGNNTFCPSCSDTVRKVDLSIGWSKSFINDQKLKRN